MPRVGEKDGPETVRCDVRVVVALEVDVYDWRVAIPSAQLMSSVVTTAQLPTKKCNTKEQL